MKIAGQMRQLLSAETRNAFKIGDMAATLRKEYGILIRDQAALLGTSYQRLAEIHRTAQTFGPKQRHYHIHFRYYEIARRAAKRLGMQPETALCEIVQMGLDTTRKAASHFARKFREQDSMRALAQSDLLAMKAQGLIDGCHLTDYRKIIAKIHDESIQLVVADPPYPRYRGYKDGTHTKVCTTKRACDNLSEQDALKVTKDLFRLLPSKLSSTGCILLFQPGGVCDRPEILLAAEQHGWSCQHAVTWHKGKVQLGNGRDAYSVASERILVFCRAGQEVINYDGSARSDVIRIVPDRRDIWTGHDHHLFEKPLELCRLLIAKHSHPGQIVFDPFGGTGNVSIAAIELNRRFICCESNRDNFAQAKKNIDEAMKLNRADAVA